MVICTQLFWVVSYVAFRSFVQRHNWNKDEFPFKNIDLLSLGHFLLCRHSDMKQIFYLLKYGCKFVTPESKHVPLQYSKHSNDAPDFYIVGIEWNLNEMVANNIRNVWLNCYKHPHFSSQSDELIVIFPYNCNHHSFYVENIVDNRNRCSWKTILKPFTMFNVLNTLKIKQLIPKHFSNHVLFEGFS